MHAKPMPESAGTAGESKPTDRPCPKCKQAGKVSFQVWSSSCGGYEDEKLTCGGCGHVWWIDGIDS